MQSAFRNDRKIKLITFLTVHNKYLLSLVVNDPLELIIKESKTENKDRQNRKSEQNKM